MGRGSLLKQQTGTGRPVLLLNSLKKIPGCGKSLGGYCTEVKNHIKELQTHGKTQPGKDWLLKFLHVSKLLVVDNIHPVMLTLDIVGLSWLARFFGFTWRTGAVPVE